MPGLTSSQLQQIFKIRNNSIYKNNLYTAWMYKKEKINDKKLFSVGFYLILSSEYFFVTVNFKFRNISKLTFFFSEFALPWCANVNEHLPNKTVNVNKIMHLESSHQKSWNRPLNRSEPLLKLYVFSLPDMKVMPQRSLQQWNHSRTEFLRIIKTNFQFFSLISDSMNHTFISRSYKTV